MLGTMLASIATAATILPTVEIAPSVYMPRINLGTCCGSEATHSFPAWYAAGGRGVDTALDYGKEVPGGKETELAAAIAKAGAPRESLFLTTKIRAGLDALHGGPLCLGLDADYALKAVKDDLEQLNVSHVDLVLLHAPCNSDKTNAKLWQGLEQALATNLTRAIGVSNYGVSHLSALLSTATTKPAVNQCQMSMAQREDDMLQQPPHGRRREDSFCAAHGIVFEAYEAMRECPFTDAAVQSIATAHGVGVAQAAAPCEERPHRPRQCPPIVCLRWVLQKGAVMAVGLGAATNASQTAGYAHEDLDLYSFELGESEMATLDAVGKPITGGGCAQGYLAVEQQA